MKLKLDQAGNAVLKDGMPVYVHDNGDEIPFDAHGATKSLKALNAEAKGHRERAEKAEKALEAYKGIDDPAAALKALATVKNFDDKKLVDAGEVEKLKADINKGWEAKLKEAMDARDKAIGTLHAEKIGGAFSRSKFIAEKLAIPYDMVEAKFGKSFKLEDGKVVAYGQDGAPIRSRSNPGEVADFDEALSILVDGYANKENILKADQKGGSGAKGGSGSGGTGSNSVTRKQFESMGPAEQMAHSKAGGKITD